MRHALVIILLVGPLQSAHGQISDDFTDLDLLTDPEWTGELQRWQIGQLRGQPALQSAGEARSDTIFLSLRSDAAFGRWAFTFAHQGVNLSTFNGARIFLAANSDDPEGPIEGYYLQLGTNNSDAISLWRADGHLSNRVELARSQSTLVEGDSSFLEVAVRRDAASNWTVEVGNHVVLEAVDDRYRSGEYFVVWVKHTAAGAESFFVDDVLIEPDETEPPPPPPPATPPPDQGAIVINEVLFDPLPGGAEFIELYNQSDESFDLSRITFRDSRSPPLEVTSEQVLFGPGEFAVLVSDAEAFVQQFRRAPFIEPSRWAALNNGGDHIVLEFDGSAIDSVAYADDAAPAGFSLERIDPAGPSDAFNFLPSLDPFGATPGRINSVYEPDAQGPDLLFVEEIAHGIYALHFDEPIDTLALLPESIRIGAARADSFRALSHSTLAVHMSKSSASEELTVSGVVDRRGNVSDQVKARIAFLPRQHELVVNEIMYEPFTDPFDGRVDQSEYIEVFNRSNRLISLTRLYLLDRTDEDGHADTVDVSLPLAASEPRSFYVIARDTLPDVPNGDVLFARAPLTLPNGGDVIRLFHPVSMLIDSLWYDPDLHHPDLVDSRGTSLERIDLNGPSHDPANWTSSVDPDGGTPGRPNSVALSVKEPPLQLGLTVNPNPFSPDQDGHEDLAAIAYHVDFVPALLRARIFRHDGVEVRRLTTATLGSNSGSFYWDGRDDLGRQLRTGIYIVLVEAFDEVRERSVFRRAAIVLARSY